MRQRLIAGNWKMHKLIGELEPYFKSFAQEAGLERDEGLSDRVGILFAVPYTMLARAAEVGQALGLRIAAQNVHAEAQGAFTGEVSLGMLREVEVTATLIGHSERRQYFGESDAAVAKKTQAALDGGFLAICCVGETLAEREAGRTEVVVRTQLQGILDVAASRRDQQRNLVIAYEPVWAIGTGRSATAAQAQEVHAMIRGELCAKLGASSADSLRILYGGSASPSNITELLAQADIDGALVGGASLKAADFAKMVLAADRRP